MRVFELCCQPAGASEIGCGLCVSKIRSPEIQHDPVKTENFDRICRYLSLKLKCCAMLRLMALLLRFNDFIRSLPVEIHCCLACEIELSCLLRFHS